MEIEESNNKMLEERKVLKEMNKKKKFANERLNNQEEVLEAELVTLEENTAELAKCGQNLQLLLQELRQIASESYEIDEQVGQQGRTRSDVMSRGGSAASDAMMMMLDIPEDDLDNFDESLRLSGPLNNFDENETLDESGVMDTLSQSRFDTPTYSENGQ